ncbi:hypothetical protein C2S51_006428 [Perilla frutescens var. frutescens]|nr:hypothetical protein C2S51_006428 [Perilla frutescens var. frutescens]
MKKRHHFVLVHGACHGAWCWYKVATRLRSEGHRVTALDMAASGAHPKRAEELGSITDYFEPLMEFFEALPPEEAAVVVGHSFGGVCISVAMEKFPRKIALAVFVTALMPGPRFALSAIVEEHQKQIDSYMDTKYLFGNGNEQPPTSMLFGPQFMASHFYQLSPPEDLSLASFAARPQPLYRPESEFREELSEEKYGSVRRVFVVCEEDKILKQEFQEWMIQSNPVDEVKIISGADHMIMLSKSNLLCDCLNDFAHKYCH